MISGILAQADYDCPNRAEADKLLQQVVKVKIIQKLQFGACLWSAYIVLGRFFL